MGLFSRKFKQPIRGTATVAGATACPSHASTARCRMNLVVSIPGVPATPTEFTAMVRADKWPFPGTVLPIEIDAAKPSRVRILWDAVPSGRARAESAAAELAAQLNSGGGPAAPSPGMTLPAGTPAQTVADLFGGGAESGGAAVPGAAVGGPDSQVGQSGFQIPPGARVVSSSVTINGQAAGALQIAAIETMTGMDLNGDGVVGVPPAAAPQRPPSGP